MTLARAVTTAVARDYGNLRRIDYVRDLMAGLCILTDRQEARVGNGGRSKRDVDGAALSANQTFG